MIENFAIGDPRSIARLNEILAELTCPTCGAKSALIEDPIDGTTYVDFPCKHD